ncbi:diacylglycerol kinase [Bauldia litoralis]|uniref:Diacylglycerol kinase n=1 Tax=Bauldia litoralis TaxID=665467 RepID=A0A1G6DHD1_9HYPH|nr:diacylglycerol kinase [Bauldia litoralis]SDB44548.1 diacylglycerol kinase (ATP) [Bauldia litoralis]
MLKAFRHVVHAAGYSVAGFGHLFRHELAARLEIGAGILSFVWLIVLGRPFRDYIILLILFCVLISVEALNTAVERIVDKLSPEISEFGKNAKDLGSAAVFAMLAAAGIFLVAVTADSAGLIAF